MRLHDQPIGVICAINSPDRALDSARRDALTVLAAFAATAIESARLNEQTATMLLSSERERIAREIHDGVMQSLFSMSLALEVCKKGIYRDPTEVYQRLDELQDQLNMAAAELRRYIYDLKPARLSELGLASAVQYWIRDVHVGHAGAGPIRHRGGVAVAQRPRRGVPLPCRQGSGLATRCATPPPGTSTCGWSTELDGSGWS